MKNPPRWLRLIALGGCIAYALFGDWLWMRLADAFLAGVLFVILIADD